MKDMSGWPHPRTVELYFYSHSCSGCSVSPTLAGWPQLCENGGWRWQKKKRTSVLLKTSLVQYPPPLPILPSGHKEAWAGGLKKSGGIVSPPGFQGRYMSLIWKKEHNV